MSDQLIKAGKCPFGCGSSDAYSEHVTDGVTWGKCFSCDRNLKVDGALDAACASAKVAPGLMWSPAELEYSDIPARKLSAATCRKYGYGIAPDGVQVAQWRDGGGAVIAQKIRRQDKSFHWWGKQPDTLFGQHLFKSRAGRRIIITEGEIDAMSVSQAFGNKWPVVSLRNGADKAGSGPVRELAAQLEWLLSYEEVVLCFDQDGPGAASAKACAELIGPGRAKIAALPRKDANEMLVAGEVKELCSAVFEARLWMPDGIVHGLDLLPNLLDPPPPGLSYPWPCFDTILHGQRSPEIIVHAAGTGVGKSQVCKEIVYGLRMTHEVPVAVISLEESPEHAALCQVGLHMDSPLHIPGEHEKYGRATIEAAGLEVLDGMWFTQATPSEESVCTQLRYLAGAFGCHHIILDHISMVIGADTHRGDERERIDKLMYGIRDAVQERDITLHVVTHLRKASGTPHEEGGRVTLQDFRGSGSIAQVADIAIGYERNQQDEDDERSRTLRCRVLKNRFTGKVGEFGALCYNTETARLIEVPLPEDEPHGFHQEGRGERPRRGEF